MSESIYALFNADKPFYVGRTTQELSARLSGHLTDVKTGNTAKCQYIRQASGPISIRLLEEVETYYNEEEIWRQEFEDLGFNLTNEKLGDDTMTNREAIQLRNDIQEVKRKLKKKPKKPLPPSKPRPVDFELHVQRLKLLYEIDPDEFHKLYEAQKSENTTGNS